MSSSFPNGSAVRLQSATPVGWQKTLPIGSRAPVEFKLGQPGPFGGKNKEATDVVRGHTPGNRNVSRTALRPEVVIQVSHSRARLSIFF